MKHGKTYSLDSLWNDVTCLSDNPGALDRLYRTPGIEAKINKRYFITPFEEEMPTTPVSAPIIEKELPQPPDNVLPKEPSVKDKLETIKQFIAFKDFKVGDYFLWKGGVMLTLDDGSKKRVPHRVYDIYNKIRNNHNPPDEILWEEIQALAQTAIDKPKPGRHLLTTMFYNDIVSNNIDKLDNEMKVMNLINSI